jgi:hypothetical protein
LSQGKALAKVTLQTFALTNGLLESCFVSSTSAKSDRI